MSVDPRSYVDRMFFDWVDGRMVPKRANTVDCSAGVPDLPKDQILILENYKRDKQRGRKDKLEGETVLLIPTDKQPIMLPLREALRAAGHMHSYVTALLRNYTIPQEQEDEGEEE